MAWKLIDTAPRDGRPVLLFCPDLFPRGHDCTNPDREWGMVVAAWRTTTWEAIIESADLEGHRPSHWMSLPLPPSDDFK